MKPSNTDTHRKVEALLRKYGWQPMRQLEPTRADAIGRGEMFELWSRQSGEFLRLCFVHFYGDGNGVEFYLRSSSGNSWAEVERVLNAPPSIENMDTLRERNAAVPDLLEGCRAAIAYLGDEAQELEREGKHNAAQNTRELSAKLNAAIKRAEGTQ